jgi:hypothetical protein
LVVEVALKQMVELQLFQPLLLSVVEVAVVRYLLPLNLEVLEAVVVLQTVRLEHQGLRIRVMPEQQETQRHRTTAAAEVVLER